MGVVQLCGQDYDEEDVLRSLRSGGELVGSVVAQLRQDAGAQSPYSVSLEIVARALKGPVCRYLTTMCGENRDLVEEAWNDALLRVFTRIDRFDETRGSKFTTWVFNQARWAALDAMRKQPRSTEPIESVHEGAFVTASRDPISKKERDAVSLSWKELTPNQRELIRLRFASGYSYAEIASKYLDGAHSEANVRVYTNRALQKMKAIFDNEMKPQT